MNDDEVAREFLRRLGVMRVRHEERVVARQRIEDGILEQLLKRPIEAKPVDGANRKARRKLAAEERRRNWKNRRAM